MQIVLFRKPSNSRDWNPDVAVLPYAELRDSAQSGKILVRNVRNFKYRSESDYDINYEDKQFDLNLLREVYLGVVPFSKNPLIAHTLIIFEFENDSVVFSIEVRKQKGQKFIAWKTALNNYELAYVIANKSDAVELREKHRSGEPVNLERLNIPKEKAQRLFADLCQRANRLKDHPEFFNLIYNSCGSNVAAHLNKVLDRKISFFYKYFAPGLLHGHLKRRKQI